MGFLGAVLPQSQNDTPLARLLSMARSRVQPDPTTTPSTATIPALPMPPMPALGAQPMTRLPDPSINTAGMGTSALAKPIDPAIANTSSRLSMDQNDLQRLTASRSGLYQITHPVDENGNPTGAPVSGLRRFAGALARIGATAEGIVAPGAAAVTPGTDQNHERLLREQTGMVNNDLGNQQEQANTTLLNAQPQLKQLAAENAFMKTQGLLGHYQDQGQHYQDQGQHMTDQIASSYHDHGYTMDETDPTGQKIRPMRYDEMSPSQQAVQDLKISQSELADAQTAYDKAKSDPNSQASQLAWGNLKARESMNSAMMLRAQAAIGQLGLAKQNTEARLHGTSNGVALPGSMIDDNGQPIGTAFQTNVRPTGTERSKADMANSAATQISDMKAIVAKHPEAFGPIAGRTTDFNVWLGSQDPDAQRFRAARTIAADHLAGTFGGRSEAALNALDNALGNFKDNPAAALAGLDQLAGANRSFQKAGTVKSTGSNAAATSSSGPTHSLATAMALPFNKGKSSAQVTSDLKAHGYTVVP